METPVQASSAAVVLCRRLHRLTIWLFCWLAMAAPLFAHDPGLSSIRIASTPAGVEAVLTIHFYDLEAVDPDLDENHDGRLDPSEFARARTRLGQLARQAVVLAVDGEAPLTFAAEPQVALIENNNLQMHLRFPPFAAGRKLLVSSPLVPRLPHGHREFIELSDANGKPAGEGFLSADENQLSLDLPAASPDTTAPLPPHQAHYGDFFLLGINHLLTGPDHLLFLAGLLIVCPSLGKAFQILTLFTIAHSVTLTLVTLDLIKPSSALVEPTIAASIAYIGIENIFRPRADLSWRGGLTFVFGLVHGLAFAGVLKELGVGTRGPSGVFQPLLYFSLGLETTQLGLAALIFPLLLWLRTKPLFIRLWVPVCSGLLALAGIYWFVGRILFNAR